MARRCLGATRVVTGWMPLEWHKGCCLMRQGPDLDHAGHAVLRHFGARQPLDEAGNTGAFIVAKGSGVVVGRRENSDPALVPRLTLTLADGSSADAPCTASGITDPSTFKGVTGPTATLGTGVNMALQFALPPLPHPLSRAMLTLVSTRNYSGATRLDLYELNAPKILQAVSPRRGSAANYIRDSNIDADPDVYFASTLTDPAQRDPLFPEWWLQPKSSTYVDPVDPVLGVPTLNVNYVTTDFAAMTSNHRWSQQRNSIHPGVPLPTRNPKNGLQIREEVDPGQYIALQHPGTPRELYMRYYIKLKAGYQCSVEGKKLPGLAGRYGKWISAGYYDNSASGGNGGSPTLGIYDTDPAHPGTPCYSGWSMRALASVGPSDANPYSEDVVPMTYAYHAQMVGPFGDTWHWGTQESGFPLLEPDSWYCIEQHVRMNTVNGPFDAYSNGTGVADGVMEVWVDGVNVLTRTDVMFRKNPAIAIDEVWLDHYHGGTHLPEAEHAFAMTALVVARRYIGPMGVPAPSWVPASGGVLGVVTPTNALLSVNDDLPGWTSAFGKIVNDFSGGIYNPYWGRNGCMVFHGGGHAATYDNSVVILDFDDLTFKRLSDPSTAWTDTSPDPLFNTTYCEYGDGQPGSAHTYDALGILGPSDGGGENGTLVRVISGAVHVRMSRNSGWSHSFDFATRVWTRSSTNALTTGIEPGQATAYDSKRKRFWWKAAPSSPNGTIRYFDVVAGTHSEVRISSDIAFVGAPDSMVMGYDPDRDIVVITGSNNGVFRLAYLSCANPAAGWTIPALSSVPVIKAGWQSPLSYVPEIGKWIVLAPNSSAQCSGVYEITVPAELTEPWPVKFRPFAGIASMPAAYVAGKRWSYAPAIKSFIWQPSSTSSTYVYRPFGV